MTSEGEGVLEVLSHNASWRPGCLPITTSTKIKKSLCSSEKVFAGANGSSVTTKSSMIHLDHEASNQRRRSLRYDSTDSSDR